MYLMFFDADRFKQINDRYGHSEGDRALRRIASALKNTCHGTDWFCARYGGDEFVVICKCDSEQTVKDIISSINEKLMHISEEEKLPYLLSLSCGYACYDDTAKSITDLIDCADRCLYEVKSMKKNGVC